MKEEREGKKEDCAGMIFVGIVAASGTRCGGKLIIIGGSIPAHNELRVIIFFSLSLNNILTLVGIDAVGLGYDKHEITWATYVIFLGSRPCVGFNGRRDFL